MVGTILRFLGTVAALPLCGRLMDGVHVMDDVHAAMVGVVLGLLYLVLRPLTRLVLSVFNFCTLGLLYVAVDAWLVWTAAGFFKDSVQLDSFWWALAVAVVINALRTLIDMMTGQLNH